MCQDATRIPKSGFLKQLTTPTHAAPNFGGLQEISLSFPSSFAVVWYSRAQADRQKKNSKISQANYECTERKLGRNKDRLP